MRRTARLLCCLVVLLSAALGLGGAAFAQLTSPWPSTPGGDTPISVAPSNPAVPLSGASPYYNTPGTPIAASRPNVSTWPGGPTPQPPADAVLMQRYPEVYGRPAAATPPPHSPPAYSPPPANSPLPPAQPQPTTQGIAPLPPVGADPAASADSAAKNTERLQRVALVGTEAILVNDVITELENRLERTDKDFEAQFREQLKEQIAASRAEGVDLIEQVRQQRRQKFTEDILAAVAIAARTRGDRSRLDQGEKMQLDMLADLLKQVVESKLIYYDARRGIPPEGFANAEKQINKLFDGNESRRLMKKAKVETWRDLENWLRSHGSSVERERRIFMERMVSQQWLQNQIRTDEEVTYDQMTSYYRERGTEFDKPARTHWQLITVRFATYPSKSDAYQAIADIGNKILGGESFSDYAEPARNKETGEMDPIREWSPPSPGAKKSAMERLPAPVERAMLGLPAGKLSPILDDWSGYYIVKVIDRLPAGRTPFESAQEEIRQKIRKQQFQDQVEKYLKKIREQVPVWTILEDPQVASAPASPVQGLYGPLTTGGVRR